MVEYPAAHKSIVTLRVVKVAYFGPKVILSTTIMSPYANLIVSLASIALAITVTSTIVDPSTPVLLQQNVPPPIGQGSLPFALVPPPLGPVLSVFGKLSPQKQEEYQRIIENDTTLTKKQLKDKQAEFVKGLSENIQVST